LSVFCLFVLATGVQPASRAETPNAAPDSKAELLVEMPAWCNTPDGMALLADGSFLLSVPNFNDVEAGSFLARITADNRVEKFLDLPRHPVTRQPMGPLGVCVVPSGDIYLADYQMTGERQSRVVKIEMNDQGRPGKLTTVVTGFHVSNAVAYHDGHLYVSETQIDTESSPATSGVFRFSLKELQEGPVQLADDETRDPHLLGIIKVYDEELPLGADGLCFDRQGNLYIGNFADGTVHQFKFDGQGAVTSNKVFARAEFMKSADGLVFDPERNVIYVADSRANAIQVVALDGSVTTLASNGDTDGLDGGMDQPCEPLLRGREVIVSNMDWPVPGCINQTYNKPATLSVIKLD
jgi:sugar lactone lactonase YvrE